MSSTVSRRPSHLRSPPSHKAVDGFCLLVVGDPAHLENGGEREELEAEIGKLNAEADLFRQRSHCQRLVGAGLLRRS